MARILTEDELREHKENAIRSIDNYLESLILSNSHDKGKADKFSYWLSDWVTFLEFESSFSPRSLRRYKRGEIIKAHLGYNVGSEEGGLHYCVVVDKDNSQNSPIVTVIPLTSVKPTTNLSKLHKGNVYLGNELFTNLNSKIISTKKQLNISLENIEKRLDEILDSEWTSQSEEIKNDLAKCKRDLTLSNRMSAEINKMKRGSIALVSQVRTISKIRIYDPKTNYDVLSNVKLSNEKLDLLDNALLQLYTNCKL